jgi:hypothetical protein
MMPLRRLEGDDREAVSQLCRPVVNAMVSVKHKRECGGWVSGHKDYAGTCQDRCKRGGSTFNAQCHHQPSWYREE